MKPDSNLAFVLGVVAGLVLAGCGASTKAVGGSGGAQGTGAASTSGGSTGNGGSIGTGGTKSSGGSNGSGGATAADAFGAVPASAWNTITLFQCRAAAAAAAAEDSQQDADATPGTFYTLESLIGVYHIGPAQKRFKIGDIVGHLRLRSLDPIFVIKVLQNSLLTGIKELRDTLIPCVLHCGKFLFQIDKNHKLPVIAFLGLV